MYTIKHVPCKTCIVDALYDGKDMTLYALLTSINHYITQYELLCSFNKYMLTQVSEYIYESNKTYYLRSH